jgi:hypothetical protein
MKSIKIKNNFKNQKGFALGIVVIIIAAFIIMTSAFFVYDELELSVFNNAKRDKLEKASVNLGIDKGFKYLRDNLVISNFSTLISTTNITTAITNSICAANIDDASSYTYQIRVQGLTTDLTLDDYNNYGYEYFIRRTQIDDNNMDYTIISCAIFNENAFNSGTTTPVAYASLNVTTSRTEGSTPVVIIKRMGSGNIAF